MEQHETELTIEELADAAEVPVRTIRYYIAEKLLEGPAARGKAAVYGEDHLLRLRLIRALSEQGVPLAQIKDRLPLRQLSLAEIRSLLAEQEQRATELKRAETTQSPREFISALLRNARAARGADASVSGPAAPRQIQASPAMPASPSPQAPLAPGQPAATWRHWELAPGVELHVRDDAQKLYHDLVDRLLRVANDLFVPEGR